MATKKRASGGSRKKAARKAAKTRKPASRKPAARKKPSAKKKVVMRARPSTGRRPRKSSATHRMLEAFRGKVDEATHARLVSRADSMLAEGAEPEAIVSALEQDLRATNPDVSLLNLVPAYPA
jgi:hypothetical protein